MLFTHNVTKCRKNQRFRRQKRAKKLRVTVNKSKNYNVIENTFGLSCICDCFKPHSAESIMYESDEKAIRSATGNPLTGLYGSYCCNSCRSGNEETWGPGFPHRPGATPLPGPLAPPGGGCWKPNGNEYGRFDPGTGDCRGLPTCKNATKIHFNTGHKKFMWN